jgi:hypothetical protein
MQRGIELPADLSGLYMPLSFSIKVQAGLAVTERCSLVQ